MTEALTERPGRRIAAVHGQARRGQGAERGLRLIALAGVLLSAACTEPPRPCEERTRRCLRIDSGDIEVAGTVYFEVRLANLCREDIEYKLCFEVPGEEADCRQGMLAPSRRAEETIALKRFGGRSRVFMRYSSEAKACRFPLTRDVDF